MFQDEVRNTNIWEKIKRRKIKWQDAWDQTCLPFIYLLICMIFSGNYWGISINLF